MLLSKLQKIDTTAIDKCPKVFVVSLALGKIIN
jgi:hypothetical protein